MGLFQFWHLIAWCVSSLVAGRPGYMMSWGRWSKGDGETWTVDSQAWRNVRDKLDQFPEMVRPYFSPPGSDCSGLEGSKWVHRQSSKLYTSMGHNAPIRMVYFSDSTHPREEKKHTNRAMYTDSRFVYYIQFYSIISPLYHHSSPLVIIVYVDPHDQQ